jgi:hypothetical protein
VLAQAHRPPPSRGALLEDDPPPPQHLLPPRSWPIPQSKRSRGRRGAGGCGGRGGAGEAAAEAPGTRRQRRRDANAMSCLCWRQWDSKEIANTVHVRQRSICLPILHYLVGLSLSRHACMQHQANRLRSGRQWADSACRWRTDGQGYSFRISWLFMSGVVALH